MEKRHFEQHQNTDEHKNQGWKPGKTIRLNLTNTPRVEFSGIALAMRLSTAW